MRSRPRRTPRTRPAPARTSRCLLTAWRVTEVPPVSRAIESGPWAERRDTSASRVGSPSAVKMGATRARSAPRDMPLDVLELRGPAVIVHAERLGPARGGDAVETRLDHGELRAAVLLLELELDQGGGLAGVVHFGIDGVGMPAVGEEPFGLDPLDHHFHGQVVVALDGELALQARPRLERAFEFDAEPGAELAGVGEGGPDTGARGAQEELLFDAIGVRRHVQPPSCMITGLRKNATPGLHFATIGG